MVRKELVGRDGELAYVDTVIGTREIGHQVITVVGDPGVGKTSFIAEVRRRAVEHGWRLVSYHDLSLEPAGRRAGECHVPDGTSPPRVMVILDDVHRSERQAMTLLDLPPTLLEGAATLLVLSYRPRQLSGRLASALAFAAGAGPVHRIELGPLSQEQVALLLPADTPPATVHDLYFASGGNPLYLAILARLRSFLRQQDAGVAGEGLALLRADTEALDADHRQVAHAASVLGDIFDIEDVQAAAQLPDDIVAEAVDQLLAVDVLRPAGGSGRLRFRHPLVRRSVYEESGAWWRRRAHARAAAALQSRGAPVELWARHLNSSALPGDLQAARLLSRAAAAVRWRAPETSAEWYAGALRLLPDISRHRARRSRLLLALAESLVAAGQLTAARGAAAAALESMPGPGWRTRRRAVVVAARIEQLLGHYGEAAAMLRREMMDGAGPKDPRSTAAIQMELATVEIMRGEFASAGAIAGQVAPQTGPVGRAWGAVAVGIIAMALCADGDVAGAAEHAERMGLLIDASADSDLVPQLPTLVWLGWTEMLLGRYEQALRRQDRAIRLARSTGQLHVLTHLLVGQGSVLRWTGRLTQARECFEEAHRAAVRTGSDVLVALSLTMLCRVHTWLGDADLAMRYGEQAVASGWRAGGWFASLAPAVLAQARLEFDSRDRGSVDAILGACGGPELPRIDVISRPDWYEVLTRAALAEGDHEGAAGWAKRAQQAAEQGSLPSQAGFAALAAAHVALDAGERGRAAELALSAATAFDGDGNRTDAARARLLAAQALIAARQGAAAAEALERAHRDAADCGAEEIRRRVEHQLGLISSADRGRAPVRRRGPLHTLSGRERQVSDLVARGLTNREIAAELFLSVKTVERHLARIFVKVDVTSRAALAAMIARDTP